MPGYRVRSISLPMAFHPSANSIKKELNNLETWIQMSSSCKPSIEAIHDGLSNLSRLYECMHEVTNMLCTTQDKNLVEELMERLVGFLDICDIMRDIMSRYKDHVRDLQHTLRRQKGDSSIGSSIAKNTNFKKTVKRDVKRLIASLKKSMVVKPQDRSHHQHHDDHYREVVIKMVMEVTVSVFEALLRSFVMLNSQAPKICKWPMVVWNLIQRRRVACEEQRYQCIEGDRLSCWWNDESVEAQIERFENGLECIFRSMIRTRANLLNIVSDY